MGVRLLLRKQFCQDKNELKQADWKCIYFEKVRKKEDERSKKLVFNHFNQTLEKASTEW